MSRLSPRVVRGSAPAAASSPARAGFRPAAFAFAVAATFGLQSAPLRAQPVGPQVIAGQASFARDGNNLVVTTQNAAGANHSAINWQSFSVPGGSITRFDQPSATSTSINRVLGNDPSAIFGTLSSNGRLVLVNPAGITVGAGAVVDTAGFTASTLGMSEADAIAGRLLFTGGSAGPLQVDGHVVARGGDIVLIAPQVQVGAKAVVESDGATVLAAGQKVEITGRGLEGIRLEVQAPQDSAVNLGSLKGDAVGMFAGTLKHSGLVQAQAVSTEGGKVVLRAQGDNLVAGSIMAQAAGGKGGSVDVLGDRVGLLAGASIEASGPVGGGQVRIGGDYQGGNAQLPNASRTYVDAAATIRADATQQGDGGRVIVWADETTQMNGQISARGGAQGGDGGFAEVSGKGHLALAGRVDLRAPHGTAGTLLLDPLDVEIVAGGSSSIASAGGDFTFDTEAGNNPTVITDTDLGEQLALSNVQVKTGNSSGTGSGGMITLTTGADVIWGSGNALFLNADKGIRLDGSVHAVQASTGAGNGGLHLLAHAGDIVQSASSALQVGSLSAVASGSVALTGPANRVVTIAGQSSGAFQFTNAQSLSVGSVSNPFGDGYAGVSAGGAVVLVANKDAGPDQGNLSFGSQSIQGSTVSLQAAGTLRASGTSISITGSHGVTLQAVNGDVDFSASGGYVTSYEGPMSVTAGGSLLAPSVNFQGGGGLTGSVTLTATGGALSFASVSAYGRYDSLGSTGGAVTVQAAGDITGGSITADGAYYGYGASDAANGGTVSINSSGGNVTVSRISSNGGYSYAQGVEAGHGGTIAITALSATAGKGNISVGSLSANGGGVSLGNGGSGGAVILTANKGITVTSGTSLGGGSASGWSGNVATDSFSVASTTPTAPLSGGQGGSFTATSGTGNISVGSIDASGGYGYSLAAGGAGGSVILRAQAAGGGVQASGALNVAGASGNDAGGGKGGTVLVDAGGNIQLRSVNAGGGSGNSGDGGAGGHIEITSANGSVALGQLAQNSISVYGGAMAAGGSTSNGSGAGGAGGSILLRAGATGSILATDSLDASAGSASGANGGAGGSVQVQGGADIQLAYVYAQGGSVTASTGTASAGRGGTIQITSDNGAIALGRQGSVGFGGGASATGGYGSSLAVAGGGGTIALSAIGDSGQIYAASSLDASAGYSDQAATTPAGTVGVVASGNIQLQDVRASASSGSGSGGLGGSITVRSTRGDVTAGYLIADGVGGGGSVAVTADSGNIALGTISANGGSAGSAAGGAGGTIQVRALGTGPGGHVTVGNYLEASGGTSSNGNGGRAGTVTVEAGSDIDVYSVGATGGTVYGSLGPAAGGAGGSVLLRSVNGSVNVRGQIYVAGGSGPGGGADGGSATVLAAGDIRVGSDLGYTDTENPQNNQDYWAIVADGGYATQGIGRGGAGGNVVLSSSGGNVGVYDRNHALGISATGGSGAGGGHGGSVQLSAGGTDPETQGAIDVPQVNVYGGEGAAAGGGAAGGAGGTLSATFSSTLASMTVDATGGLGQDGGSVVHSGGQGGAGGTISLTKTGTDDLALAGMTLVASGARGGNASSDPNSTSALAGGQGGAGGTIAVSTSGSLSMADGQLSSTAGDGGVGTDDSLAASGAAGLTQVLAEGDIDLSGSDPQTLYMYRSGFTARAGGNIYLNSALTTAGGAVTLSAGDAAFGLRKPDAVLEVMAPIDTTDSGSSPAAAVRLSASGSMTLDAQPVRNVASMSLMAVAAPPPAITGSTVEMTAPEITVAASTAVIGHDGIQVTTDALALDGSLDAGTSTANIRALSATREIHLGGTDETGTLNLDQGELSRITAGELAIGDLASANRISVDSAITVDPTLLMGTAGDFRLAASATSYGEGIAIAARNVDFTGGSLATPNGRWLVYVGGALGDSNFGTVASGNQALWNRTPANSPPETVSESGNRYLFAYQPSVTATAPTLSREYDGTTAFSGLTPTITGVVNAADYGNVFLQDVVDVQLLLPGLTKNVGTYAITQGATSLPAGYAFNFVNGSATITKRALDLGIRALDKTYDATTRAGTAVTADRVVAGDDLGYQVVANFSDKNAGSNKSVRIGSITLTGADAGNYAVGTAPAGATASITPAPLDIQANNLSKVQGTEYTFRGTEFSASGLQGGETVDSVSLASDGAPAAAPVGAYPIFAGNAVGGNGFLASNYDIHYLNGALAVGSPQAVQQVLSQVVTFASLFVNEAQAQAQQDIDRLKKDLGRDDIVVDQCRP